MTVKLPEEDQKQLVRIFHLEDKLFSEVIGFATEFQPGQYPEELLNSLINKVAIDPETIDVFVKLMFSMGHREESVRELGLGFYKVYLKNVEQEKALDESSFLEKFGEIHKCSTPVRITKALSDTKLGYGKYLVSQKIFTDLKPVYTEDVENLSFFTVTHNLSLTVVDNSNQDEKEQVINISIDSNDITKLSELLTKAETAKKLLIEKLERQGLKFLD